MTVKYIFRQGRKEPTDEQLELEEMFKQWERDTIEEQKRKKSIEWKKDLEERAKELGFKEVPRWMITS
jgi:hypothetical protein